MLAKFSRFNAKGRYVSLEKEKETFCVVFAYKMICKRQFLASNEMQKRIVIK